MAKADIKKEDVIEFIALRFRKLPADTQEVLKSAACIGNQFDLETLAIVHQRSETEIAADLWQAVRAGSIFPQGEIYEFVDKGESDLVSIFPAGAREQSPTIYRFLHDRVQQAAYSLIPEAQLIPPN